MLLVLAGRLTQFIIAFMSIKLMTTLLSPVEVGKVTLITTATAFFALFLVNPIGMFINRRLHVWVANGFLKHYFHLFCGYLFIVASTAAFITWCLLHSHLMEVAISPIWCAILIAGSLLFNSINQTLVPSMNMLERIRPFVFFTICTLTVGLIASVVLVKGLGANAVAWLAGPIISQFVFSIIAYKIFFREMPSKFRGLEGRDYRQLSNFAWPISLAVGFNWLHMQGYRFVLADQFGLADLGLFAAGYGLASSLTTACESVTTSWFQPRFYRDANSADASVRAQAWGVYASTMLPFTILASSGIFMTAPYLTTIMLGPTYHTAVLYVMMGALAEWGRTIFNIFVLDAHGSMNTRRLIVPSLIGMLITYLMMIVPLSLRMLDVIPLVVLAGCLVMSAIIRLRATQKNASGGVDWNKVMLTTAGTAVVCVLFELGRRFLLPVFGSFEAYAALLAALGLWGSFSMILFRYREFSF